MRDFCSGHLKLSFITENLDDFGPSSPPRNTSTTSPSSLTSSRAKRNDDKTAPSSDASVSLVSPCAKSLEQFQWNWPKKTNRAQIQNLFRLKFLDDFANVVFIGSVGLAKSHLAITLGLAACHQGHSVLFASTVDVINTLAGAQATAQLKLELRKYTRPRVLILDEIGYLPIDKTGADLLFQIISQRYERGSTILTTNRVYKKWAEIFNNDSTLTSAVLDRLLHHAETVTIESKSYRMKDQLEES